MTTRFCDTYGDGPMRNIFEAGNELLQNSALIKPARKFSLLMISVCMVHIFYVCFFFYLDMPILYIYNMASVIFYIFSANIKNENYYSIVYTGCFVEICIHALMTSCLLPYDCGFAAFCVIISPVAFYMAFSLSAFRRNMLTPSVYAVCSAIVFVICPFLRLHVDSFYTQMTERQMAILFGLNSFIIFFTLLFSSILFVYEIRYHQAILKNKNRYLDTLASLDPLTMLLNRRRMQDFMDQAFLDAADGAHPFCLVLCDIDDFKKINDTYGHACGDQVLIHIAEIIRSNVRRDDNVCRWGGEEILLLLHTDPKHAREIAERIRKEVEETPTISLNHRIHHTLTLGIASYEKDVPLDTLIRLADNRLYTGKRTGKNVVIS